LQSFPFSPRTRELVMEGLIATRSWESPAWAKLVEHAAATRDVHLRDLLADAARSAELFAEAEGITIDYSRQRVTGETMDLLEQLAAAARLPEKIEAMHSGAHINITEDRAVAHTALRAQADEELFVDGENVVPEVHAVLKRIAEFSAAVRDGAHLGATGKRLTQVVAIGIGGSYLGPEFVHEALRTDPAGAAAAAGRTLHFLANVDPVDVRRALEGFDAETTLAIVISKTFTTAETMMNAATVKHWLLESLATSHPEVSAAAVARQHIVAGSANVPAAQKFGIAPENVFGFWDWVGGRYSVCSAVGVVPLALQYGFPIVREFLDGANAMDRHFFSSAIPLRQNLPVVLGLLGVWNATFLGHPARALLPYSQALVRFAAHIQQVDMESNGKRVAMDGSAVPFPTGEVNFGEPGTNGQHSFYQLIHQGTVVPCDFIGFCESQAPVALKGEAVSNHDELMSNFFAQPDALAVGKPIEAVLAEGTPAAIAEHKVFPGNRCVL
jgi:glucose-6-phosphate isomerase